MLHGGVPCAWIYNNTGKSVLAAAVCDDTNNVSWRLFPIQGPYHDPRVSSLIVTFVAVIVTAIWGAVNVSSAQKCLSSSMLLAASRSCT